MVSIYVPVYLSINLFIDLSIYPSESIHLPCTDTILMFLNWNFNSSYSVNTTDSKHMTKSSTSLWRVSLMVSFRSVVFFQAATDKYLRPGLQWSTNARVHHRAVRKDIYLYLSTYLSIYRPIYLSLSLSISPSIYLSLYVSIYLSMYRSKHLSMHLSIYLSLHLSIYCCCSCSCCGWCRRRCRRRGCCCWLLLLLFLLLLLLLLLSSKLG